MNIKAALTAAAILAVAPTLTTTANAQVLGNVPFAAAVTDTCVLTVGTPGVLDSNANYTTLSSEQGVGAAGTVTAVTTSAVYNISVADPTAFDSTPAGADVSNVSFTAKLQGSGVTTITDLVSGATATLGLGTTNVDVDLAVTNNNGSFAAGAYAATVVVTCQ